MTVESVPKEEGVPTSKPADRPPEPQSEEIELDLTLAQASHTQASQSESQKRTVPPNRRPISQRSFFMQTLFVATVASPQVLCEAQVGMLLVSLEDIGLQVGTHDERELSWFPAAYGLAIGVFLITSGRLGDLYGSRLLWLSGFVISVISNIGSGFCTEKISFNICRALAGVGVAASLPNAIAILGQSYASPRSRAVVFSVVGALAPVGFVLGALIGGFWAFEVDSRWIWWFTSIVCFALLACGWFLIPPSTSDPALPRQKFDIIGAVLLMLFLGLFNFAWNQGPVVGWPQPYVYALLILSILAGVGFYFWERRAGEDALIPVEVLHKNSLLVYVCLWLGWMSFGIWSLYTVQFLRNIRGVENTLLLAALNVPALPAGVIAALAAPYAIRHFAGHTIFFFSMISFGLGNLLGALTPVNLTYWAVTFPSFLLVAAGPDLSYTTGQLIVTNSVDVAYHGIAGGIITTVMYYSQSIGLGMAATVERYTAGDDQLKGYRAAFWFGTGLAGLAAVVVASFIRMPKQAAHRE